MNNNLYVGNLAFQTTVDDLTRAFSHYGSVVRACVVTNPETGESCGFGYVEMSEGGHQAIAGLDGSLCQGRSLTVHQTKLKDYFWPDGDTRESIPVMPVYQPDGDNREGIPVMPDYQFRGWPSPIIDAPPNEEGSWASLYDDCSATRDAEAYCASQNGEGYTGPDGY